MNSNIIPYMTFQRWKTGRFNKAKLQNNISMKKENVKTQSRNKGISICHPSAINKRKQEINVNPNLGKI